MSRKVKVVLSTDHTEIVEVADDYTLLLDDDSQWLLVDTADGGLFAFPARLVVSVVVQGRPAS